MSLRIPVPANAAAEIKQLALRFSKEIYKLTNARIRGRKLNDSFVKPLGYKSFNEVIRLSSRSNSLFPMKDYIEQLKTDLIHYLPISVSCDHIVEALELASDPGYITLTIDCRYAPASHTATLTNSFFFKDFLLHGSLEGKQHNVGLMCLLNPSYSKRQDTTSNHIQITLDYRKWPNESDPLIDWDKLNSFIRMVSINANSDNGVEIEILRYKIEDKPEVLSKVNEYGIFEWLPKIWIIDIGYAHRGLINDFNELYDPSGVKGRAIQANTNSLNIFSTQNESNRLTSPFSRTEQQGTPASLNVFNDVSGIEIISIIRAMVVEEIDLFTEKQKIAAEMILNAMALVIDDFKRTNKGNTVDLSMFNYWIANIPELLKEEWLTSSAKLSLTKAYDLAVFVDILESLRIRDLLPY